MTIDIEDIKTALRTMVANNELSINVSTIHRGLGEYKVEVSLYLDRAELLSASDTFTVDT